MMSECGREVYGEERDMTEDTAAVTLSDISSVPPVELSVIGDTSF